MGNKKPILLVILDGFGYRSETFYNAVYHANKPNLDGWLKTYPHTALCASGECVGLLPGYIGNSEVGHLTMGVGKVIKQPVVIIHEVIKDQTFFDNETLKKSLEKVKHGSGRLHIMGLLSDAGVHSHIEHLYAFLKAAKKHNIKEVYIHGFLDGRDVSPKTAAKYLEALGKFIKKNKIGKLASLHGRFYAMDRDKNWDRIKESYDVLVGTSKDKDQFCCELDKREDQCWKEILEKSYENVITDEFFVPINIVPEGVIKNGDGVIFFNFRPDRARQVTQCFIDKNFDHFKTQDYSLSCFVTPVTYAHNLKTDIMYTQDMINNTLKEILNNMGKTIFSIGETEKFAHITYFFNGGKEERLEHETRVLIPSIKAKDYSEKPEMSAEKITAAVIDSLKHNPKDFYLINYANCDMVGHSGDFQATVKAVECIDRELKKLYDVAIEKMDGVMYITADHGNAEQMFDQGTGQPNTAHTTNPVPFIVIQKGLENSNVKLELKQLADIAPFILKNMGVKNPYFK